MSNDLFGFKKYLEKLCPDELCPDDLISRRAILFDILEVMPNDIDPDLKKGEFIGLMMAAKKVVNSKRKCGESIFCICKNCKHWDRRDDFAPGLGVCSIHQRVRSETYFCADAERKD